MAYSAASVKDSIIDSCLPCAKEDDDNDQRDDLNDGDDDDDDSDDKHIWWSVSLYK